MLHKVLFVDDEASIRLTLPHILRLKGYEVTATGTVSDALAAMQREKFDVLIADLNIGQPGDGFTVVSAMRRVQPQAVTLILTGYPAFESALEAIRSQVDDYLVKPADVEHLCDVIEKNLDQHTPIAHITPRKLWLVMRDHRSDVLERWKLEMLKDSSFDAGARDGEEPASYIGMIIDELANTLEARMQHPNARSLEAATRHGLICRERGSSLSDLIKEIRTLRLVLFKVIQQNLLAVNTSYVISDMTCIADILDRQLQTSIEAYQGAARKAS